MPRVDFYILSEHHNPDRFLCQLSQKIWQQGHQIYIHTSNEATAETLSDRLWTFSDISFIPHELFVSDSAESPISLGWRETCPQHGDVLVNLSEQIPAFAEGFQRIVELVAGNESQRQKARAHYRDYRERDYELNNHQME